MWLRQRIRLHKCGWVIALLLYVYYLQRWFSHDCERPHKDEQNLSVIVEESPIPVHRIISDDNMVFQKITVREGERDKWAEKIVSLSFNGKQKRRVFCFAFKIM